MSEMRLYKQLGKAIAKRREAIGLKQDEVAKAIGLARASLANIENGRQRILVHQLYLLVKALKLSSITDLAPHTWEFDHEEDVPPLVVTGGQGADSVTVLTDVQQATVHNIVRSAFGPLNRKGTR
ncbi:MAG: hypothetical protein DI533_17335 [Cereibacter sphaeroides]|uniref:HTH cro/C1-type domain-containing protein n=1 Tax=Cereibacter sphaeroides TaxID=1063 RepID=A0A2W5TKF8_CERSP|nr:MAG: hypothetical protein DI533_17335 [Cereibacter sphaeroides]